MANNIISHHNQPTTLTADVPVERKATPALDNPNNNNKKEENQMADVDTNFLSSQHADIRREAAEHRASILLEDMKGFDRVNADVLKSGWAGVDATKDARYDVNTRIESTADRVVDRVEDTKDTILARSWDMGRDLFDVRAQIISAQQQVVAGFLGASKDAEINALRTQVELAKQTTYLSDKIDAGNETTQALINALNDQSLNRQLIERNTEIVEEREGRRYWRHHGEQNQWASQFSALQNQMQNFNSQLSEARQGMVNFGTMSGQSGQQTSTNNNVR
jgi:hypothetical protein